MKKLAIEKGIKFYTHLPLYNFNDLECHPRIDVGGILVVSLPLITGIKLVIITVRGNRRKSRQGWFRLLVQDMGVQPHRTFAR